VNSTADLAPGASRLTAALDVPPGFQWPKVKDRPLDAIAQVRLSDIAPFDEDGLLPKTGWLCFFYAATAESPASGCSPEERDAWRVLYFDGDAGALQRTPPPPPLEEEFPPCGVRFWKEWTLPSLAEEPKLLHDDRCGGYYGDACGALAGRPQENGWHHLLGHAQHGGGRMRPICQLASNGVAVDGNTDPKDPKVRELIADLSDWVLLLQLQLDALEEPDADSSTPDWRPRGSAQGLYYWIRKPDLTKRDFSKVWVLRTG
jgi:hypothetical protein